MLTKKDLLLIVLVIGLLVSLIFNYKSRQSFVPFDDSELRDSIALQQLIIEAQKEVFATYTLKRDTVRLIETQVKSYYHEIYTFNGIATNPQLDSVIRSNW